MKMKLTALILILVLLCPAFSAMADFSDISGLSCEQDVRFLETLGIVEGFSANEYAPDELLSRAEMVTIALRTMDMSAPGYDGDAIFSDVSEDYWAYYEISAACEMGLVNGVGDGRFAPEQPVSFNQAVKMLVNVLGYGYIAEIKGGYPSGYLELARKLDLDEDITLRGEAEITRGEMATLVVNALNANVAEITGVSLDSEDYFQRISETGEILIKYYLEKDRIEGRVDASYYQSVDGSLAPDDNTVIIGGEVLYAGDSDVEAMIGEDVIAYVDEESDNSPYPEVIFAFSDASEVLKLNSLNTEYDASNNSLLYTNEEGSERKLSLTGADIFVNGVEKLNITGEELKNSDIKYIHNSDGKLFIINSYTDKVVKSVDTEEEVIYLNDGTSVELEDYDRFIIRHKTGRKLDLTEIIRWNILSCYSAGRNSARIFTAVVCDDAAVEGTVDEFSQSGGSREVLVGDKVYTVSDSLDGTIPAVGKDIKFYTNHLGQIACVSNEIVTYKYGYATGIKQKTFTEAAQMRIFTHNGEFKVFTLSEKLKVNGYQVDVSKLESNADFFTFGKFREQLIRYESGSDDVVKSITTCSEGIVGATDRESFGRNFFAEDYAGRWLGTFATKYTVDQDTLYFTVPLYDNPEDKAYKVTPIGDLTHFTSNVSNAYFYDIDEDNVIGVILKVVDISVGDAFNFQSGSVMCGVVSEKKTVYDEDKGAVKALTIINGNAKKLVIIDEQESPMRMTINANAGCSVITNEDDPCYGDTNISYDNVDVGDIMGFMVNEDGVAYDAQMLVRRKYPKVYESLSVDDPSENYSETGYYEWASSTVKHISEHGIIADVNIHSGGPYERLYLKAPNVLAYDSEKNRIQTITWDSIKEGERFSTCDWSIYPSMVLVYR